MRLFRGKPSGLPKAVAPAPAQDLAPTEAPSAPGPKPISLALQGGGAHGAFEWGVLDRLLAEPALSIEAVTAVSAGAMNAVALASGLAKEGAQGARDSLERFWRAVNQAGGRNVFGDSNIWTAAFSPQWLQGSPAYRYFEGLLLSSSPYEFNPFNLNPLRDALHGSVDFEAVRKGSLKLFIGATDVEAGRQHIFPREDLTEEVVLASAALPQLFRAVTVQSRAYWDGGCLGNPPLWPLFYTDAPQDLLLVMINPLQRKGVPTSAGEIMDRLNEITFNASLLAELRSVAFVQKLIEGDMLTPEARSGYRYIRTHAILADGELDDLPLSSKFNTEWSFLTDLKGRGQKAADRWLQAHLGQVGARSTLDIHKDIL